jgi:signal transduction histidine kinase
MRNGGSPNIIDWITTSLRWLILLGLTISLAANTSIAFQIRMVLLGAVLWNVILTVLAAFNRRIPAHRYLVVAVDALVAALLFYLSGTLGGNIAWVGLLPLTSAAMYFRVRGALVATLASVVIEGILALVYYPLMTVLIYMGPLILVYLAFGLLLGTVVQRMLGDIWRAQRDQAAVQREAERSERERSRALYKLISALGATLNYQRVLETALDLGYSTLAGPNGSSEHMVSAVFLYTEGEAKSTELRVGSARRFTPADMRITLPGREGLIGRAIDEGEARSVNNVAKDAELGRIVALRACRAAYCIPLRMGLDTYGVMLFAHPDENFFTSERHEILDIIGSQTVIAIQNARLYRDLELEKERITEIQEEARKKLARDLHDGPTQSVAALAMRVNFARRLIDRDVKAAVEELVKIEDLARRTTKEIRHMLFTLRPLVLESQGLIAAFESMAEKMRDTYNQNVIIEADPGVISQMELSKQGVIFYITEEALNNARKHAQATHIWVRLKQAGDELALLEIEDDGVGFDSEAVEANYDSRGSLGMVNMRERTELVNGVLQLESVPGKGTRISILVPLSEEAADRMRRGL